VAKLTLAEIENGIRALRETQVYLHAIAVNPEHDFWQAWNETATCSIDVVLRRSIELRNRMIAATPGDEASDDEASDDEDDAA
jgi:hypothetical protein